MSHLERKTKKQLLSIINELTRENLKFRRAHQSLESDWYLMDNKINELNKLNTALFVIVVILFILLITGIVTFVI